MVYHLLGDFLVTLIVKFVAVDFATRQALLPLPAVNFSYVRISVKDGSCGRMSETTTTTASFNQDRSRPCPDTMQDITVVGG